MILLFFQILICFSSSKFIEDDIELEKLAKNDENNFESENKDDLQGIPESLADDPEIHEAWLKRKIEIHRKIAELEALHHEEEIEEEDDEYIKKIEEIQKSLNKKKFYQEYRKKKDEQSLNEIQDTEDTADHNKESNFLENIRQFNDVAKSLHEIIKDNSKQNNVNSKEKQQQDANTKQNNNDFPSTNNANLELEQPTIPITSSQEITKTLDTPENDEVSTRKININIKYLLVPFIILAAALVLIYKIFKNQIKRWIRHKKSDELPNSLKYN